jgi:hypothetical protein
MNERTRPASGLKIVDPIVGVRSNQCLVKVIKPTAWSGSGFSVAAGFPGIATRPNAGDSQEVAV